LSTVDADLTRGGWVDPRAGQVTFGRYGTSWLELRTDLRPRTHELYAGLLRRNLVPAFGDVELGRLSPSVVRAWFSDVSGEDGPGRATAARCYRLLRTILNTAVTDGLIVKNPCQVKGAGAERSPERPIATVAEVHALADAIAPRFRAAVLLAAFCSLRRGEILGLRRADLDLLHGTVTVRRAVVSLADGTLHIGDPKTAASRRTIAIPRVIMAVLQSHLDQYAEPTAEATLFVGEKGSLLRPHVLQIAWDRARRQTGLGHLHFHDLRHSGNTWAAATGASTAELMARMGHASAAAALRYQHATADRDRAIANALSDLGEKALGSVVELRAEHRRSS
jgi:integrase